MPQHSDLAPTSGGSVGIRQAGETPESKKLNAFRFTPKHIIPLTYWLDTRVTNYGIAQLYVVQFFLFGTVFAAAAGEFLPSFWKTLATLWLSYISIYEIGYLANDIWSQPREQRDGLNHHKPRVLANTGYLVAAVLLRIITAIFLLRLLPFEFSTRATYVLLLMAIAFSIHNLIRYPWRACTFFALHATKYGLILAAISKSVPIYPSICFISIPAFATTLSYMHSKRIATMKWCAISAHSVYQFRICSFAFAVAALVAQFTQPIWSQTLMTLALFFVVIDFLTVIRVFVKRASASLSDRSSVVHFHTEFSHDCQLPLTLVAKYLSKLQVRQGYITDHVDFLSATDYRVLQQQAFSENEKSGSPKLIPGLEYNVCGQHVLALGISERIEIDEENPESVLKLKQLSERVIWAHPLFAIRPVLTSANYRQSLLDLLRAVDGYEWINFKSTRGRQFHWRHIVLALLGIAIRPEKQLTIGPDAHRTEDWKEFGKRWGVCID